VTRFWLHGKISVYFGVFSINNSLIDLSNDIISLDHSTSNTFELTNDYIDAKHQEGKDYTDTEVENLRNEGLIQEAITQVLAWITSDEGKRFRKKELDTSIGTECLLDVQRLSLCGFLCFRFAI
jgi:hypothetical protein